jgi:ketosteroid isomerase-like protein
LNDTEKMLAQIIDGYKAAVLTKDVEAFMRLYDPKVRVFDAWSVWSYDDAASWRRTVEGWFGSLGEERVQVSFDEVVVSEAGGSAIVSAIVTYASLAPDGSILRSMQNRLSWGIQKGTDGYRIVHEHTSMPIGFEDMKAITQRRSS